MVAEASGLRPARSTFAIGSSRWRLDARHIPLGAELARRASWGSPHEGITMTRATAAPTLPLPLPRSRARSIALGAAAIVGTLCVGVATGWGVGHLRSVQEVRQAQGMLASVRTEHQIDEERIRALEARRSLAQAVSSLDDRNFGTAGAMLTNAAEWLARSEREERRNLGAEIAAARVVAVDDLQRDRATVRAFAVRLETSLESPRTTERRTKNPARSERASM